MVRKLIKYILIGVLALVLLAFGAVAALFLFFYVNDPGPEILKSVESHDQKYVADLFRTNGGATTKFGYTISLREKGAPPNMRRGHIAGSEEGELFFVWNASNELG